VVPTLSLTLTLTSDFVGLLWCIMDLVIKAGRPLCCNVLPLPHYLVVILVNILITCSTVVLQCYLRQAIPMEQAKNSTLCNFVLPGPIITKLDVVTLLW